MIFNFLLGGVIGIIYYLIICQLSNNIFLENKSMMAIQRSIFFIYFGGLLGLFIGSKIDRKSNSALKIGLYFGSPLLLFNSLIINWEHMNSDTKLILLGINMGLLVWYSYYKLNDNKKTKKLKSTSKST
jgi:hypothetical protein